MFYLIYKITNKVNGKFYIGAHKTKSIDDGYMGSGKYLKRAINKYGIENFKKEILCYCSSESEMWYKESEMVVMNENSYNLKKGGYGGWDHIPKDHWTHHIDHMKRMAKVRVDKYNSDENFKQKVKNNISKKVRLKYENDVDFREKNKQHLNSIWPGRKHTIESKKKMSLSAQDKHDGEKNSQFGSMWITNGFENKKIKKSDTVPSGWYQGRVMKERGQDGNAPVC